MLNKIYKKLFLCFCIFVFLCFLIPCKPVSAVIDTQYDKFGISSIAVSAKTGNVIGGKSMDQVLPYASLTKLMTALVLIDLGIENKMTKQITITKSDMQHVNPYIEVGDITSSVNIKDGDKVLVKDLWHAMLIASSNESAAALARSMGLSEANFVKRMNKKAKALGLKKTYFTEMTGIDPKNVGTAREMAVIARKAYGFPLINNTSIKTAYQFKTLNTKRLVGVYSRNTSLNNMKPVAMKVGFLVEAKSNVALRLKKGAKDRVIVVLHSAGSARRNVEINRLMSL
jgi:serine-type D-Ala-D-Ala endopeptidase (penicillin-binding protein 7)